MRRVQSIALVHETLSVSIDESVDFDEIVDRLLVMLSDAKHLAGASQTIEAGGESSSGAATSFAALRMTVVSCVHAFTASCSPATSS